MQLQKITDKGKTGNFYVGNSEIFTIEWNGASKTRFYAFDDSYKLREVSKEYFAIETIGLNYKKIETELQDNIESYRTCKDKNNNIYFCNHLDNILYGFNDKANLFLKWNISDIGQGHNAYDIQCESTDLIWIAFPTGGTVTQVSITKKKETYKIGNYAWDDDESELLSYPESIFIKNNFLFIPNMGNNKLFKVDLSSQEIKL